jgi:hypothetical protein
MLFLSGHPFLILLRDTVRVKGGVHQMRLGGCSLHNGSLFQLPLSKCNSTRPLLATRIQGRGAQCTRLALHRAPAQLA